MHLVVFLFSIVDVEHGHMPSTCPNTGLVVFTKDSFCTPFVHTFFMGIFPQLPQTCHPSLVVNVENIGEENESEQQIKAFCYSKYNTTTSDLELYFNVSLLLLLLPLNNCIYNQQLMYHCKRLSLLQLFMESRLNNSLQQQD